MASLGNFNAREVEPQSLLTTIPAGVYLGQIIQAEARPTKAGTGSYVELIHEIIDGEHRGRKVYFLMNLNNPNPVAVEIAKKQLSAICHAIGNLDVHDTSDLLWKPMRLHVGVKPASGDFKAKNEINGWEKIQAGYQQSARQQTQQQPALVQAATTPGSYAERRATWTQNKP